ncbi:MAG: glycosyltransferase family 4 protein [Magnetococcales bacterium]|nr:glycosyltransferase family 4 protein [Magnetococcales bacterium]
MKRLTTMAYLSSAFLPSRQANAIQVMKMCNAFASLGVDLHLHALTPKPGPDTPREVDPLDFYGATAPFSLSIHPWSHFYKFRINELEALYRGWSQARQTLREGRDLVFGRSLEGCCFAAQMGLPVIFETHQPPEAWGSTLFARHLLTKLITHPNLLGIVVISQPLKRMYLSAFTLPQERVMVAPDAADPLPEMAEQETPAPLGLPERLQVGYVGHLYPGRGMEIIAGLAGSCPWADFHVVGGMSQDVDAWQKKLEKHDNLTFHGFLPPPEAENVRRGFDITLAPYQRKIAVAGGGGDTSGYASPLKIFEYMALGKPMLVSDLPVLHEVLRGGENCLFCVPDDLSSWVGALERLRDDPDLARRLEARALADFLTRHTWQRRVEGILDHFGVGVGR